MDSSSIRVKQYKKFYNALAYKFKKHTKIELEFLATEILMKKQQDSYRNSILPNLIFEIYTIIDMKDTQPDPFWQLVDYLSDFIQIVRTRHNYKSVFQKITKNGIEIYHKFSAPDCQLSISNNKRSILKGGVVCLCKKDIRKKYQCYKCEIECHKSCLSWTQGDLICPNCMLYYYDPFMKVKQILIKSQLLEDRFVYKFNIDQTMMKEHYYLVIKCIKIEMKVSQKYNECQINFPQKAMVKLNNRTVQTYKPEKNDYIRKRDKPIIINLMQNFNDFLKKGLNIFYCEFDFEREENDNIEYVFSISICEYRSVEQVISDKVYEQSSQKNKLQLSKNYIRESFRSAMDPLKIKVALSDPITTKQIKIPVRGDNCKHLTVFCLETYLKNLSSTDFKKMECPQCKKLILDFKIDFYLVEILFEFQSYITNKNLEQEITMFQNLSYKFHEAPPINSQEFLSISNHMSIEPKKQSPKQKKHKVNNISQHTDEDPNDENFELFSSSQQKQSQPQSSFFVKRGRGRPPGSKNKTPEERFKNKMQEILKQANKMYSFNIAQQSITTLSDEERKIVDAIKKYTHSETVPDSILLESYYDTVQLQKKVKNYLVYGEQNLKEEYCQIIQYQINLVKKNILKIFHQLL